MSAEDFRPTRIERNLPVWRALVQHLQDRLGYLRAQNDGQFDAQVTANLRGRIAEIKALLAVDIPDSE